MPLEQRIHLHTKVLRLRREGLSHSQIIEVIHKGDGVRLHESRISYWIRGLQAPFGNINKFEAKPSRTLAYIIGVKASDGCAYENMKQRRYEFALNTIDYEFAAETVDT